MKMYVLSLGAGLLVGVIYSFLNVRSPAPPLVALVGLLGILIGEQALPIAKQMTAWSDLSTAWRQAERAAHIPGPLFGHHSHSATSSDASVSERAS